MPDPAFPGRSARLAVLIDADNAQASNIEALLAEIATYGTAQVKRAYGDWTGTNLKSWKDELLRQSIQPIQQFAYTHGKNATDSALIIDAMDLLYSGRFDGFCLVSSDSDFTRLAARLRESGLTVYGFGERKTPKPFVAACDQFIYVENLVSAQAAAQADDLVEPPAPPQARDLVARLKSDARLLGRIRSAVQDASDDDGWAALGVVGQIIVKQNPDFDPRTYGHAKLSDLLTATGLFDLRRSARGDGTSTSVYVSDRRGRPA